MTVRNIIRIDENKCTGCGLCVTACAEGAIKIIDSKAKLVSESYCDGLGACLGHCPEDAITIEQREVAEFDEEAVKARLGHEGEPVGWAVPTISPRVEESVCNAHPTVCPGLAMQQFTDSDSKDADDAAAVPSQLGQWPVQLKLVSPTAPYFAGADLLLVADCVPFAMADFHQRFLKGRAVAVGCPKLDDARLYIDKLTQIIGSQDLNSLTVVHMEVPCCSGMTHIAREAIARAGKAISVQDITISLRGEVIRSESPNAGAASEVRTAGDHA